MDAASLDYSNWNGALLDRFFNRARRYRSVRLRIDEDALEQLGGSKEQLVAALRTEVERQGTRDIQSLGLVFWHSWRRECQEAQDSGKEVPRPTYLPILGLYVLAVNHGGGKHPPHKYYLRLHDLLGKPAQEITSISPSITLWRDLAKWSATCMGGRLGIFEDVIVGRQRAVGYPRRQILLAPREIPALKLGFINTGLLPGSLPTDPDLWKAALAAPRLLTRTKGLLEKGLGDKETQDLVSDIRSEFECWTSIGSAELESVSHARLPLRVVLSYSGRSLTKLHLETEAVEGLTDGDRVAHEEGAMGGEATGWIDLVPDGETGTARLDEGGKERPWLPSGGIFGAVSLRLDGTRFSIERRRSRYVLLGRGDNLGVFKEFKESELQPGRRYFVLTSDPRSVEAARFIGEFLGEWGPFELLAGVQSRKFLAADQVPGIAGVRLDLVGGIPTAAGARDYVPFALPRVRVVLTDDSAAADVDVQYFDEFGRPCGPSRSISASIECAVSEAGAAVDAFTPVCVADLPALPDRAFAAEIALPDHDLRRSFFVDRYPGVSGESDIPARDQFGRVSLSDAVFRGLSVLVDIAGAETPLPLDKKPVRPPCSKLGDDEAGLNLMHLMRSTTPLRWGRGKRLLPNCLGSMKGDVNLAFEVSILHSLGIVEIEEGNEIGWERLVAIPPSLVLLPSLANLGTSPEAGLQQGHQALLVGCWLTSELQGLEREARRYGVLLMESHHEGRYSLIPHRRTLIAEGDHQLDRIARVADLLGRVPRSCDLLDSLAPLPHLSEAPGWMPGGISPAWRRHYFDPRALRLRDQPPNEEDRYVSVQCALPDRPGWRFFLVDRESERRLQVADRQLGRWFVRVSTCPGAPVPVSHDTLVLPEELRLPQVLERALVLGSGKAPLLMVYSTSRSPFHRTAAARRFSIPTPPVPNSARATEAGPSGRFICYPGVYGTAAWPRRRPMPMMGSFPEEVLAPTDQSTHDQAR